MSYMSVCHIVEAFEADYRAEFHTFKASLIGLLFKAFRVEERD